MTSRRVAIIQSSYIPWRGYFGIISACDTFIFLDSVQFTRRDWRSRNRLRDRNAEYWLSVPLVQRGQYLSAIDEMKVSDADWASKHWRRIDECYRRAPAFNDVAPIIKNAYDLVGNTEHLSAINISLISSLCQALCLKVELTRDIDHVPRHELISMDPTARLVALCQASKATHYVSGPAARNYLNIDRFSEAGIAVEWAEYSQLQPYKQIHGGFEPQVSIIDTLLNVGLEQTRCMLSSVLIT